MRRIKPESGVTAEAINRESHVLSAAPAMKRVTDAQESLRVEFAEHACKPQVPKDNSLYVYDVRRSSSRKMGRTG
jgi:hypothetical protein